MVLEGIDTSKYQGVVDWKAARSAGKQFALPQATFGLAGNDPMFQQSWASLHLIGMPRIAYHFFYDIYDGVAQANNLHQFVHDSGGFVYGDAVAVDVEEVSVTDATLCIDRLEAFILQAWDQIAKPVFIYTNADTWKNRLGNPTNGIFARCPLWQAALGPKIDRLAAWPSGLSILQYSFSGHCPGITGNVDLDRFYGSMVQLNKILHTLP
jgi:lysozyme